MPGSRRASQHAVWDSESPHRRSLDAIHRRFGAGTDTVPFLIKVLLQGGFVMPCFIQLFVMLKSSDHFYAQIVLSLVAPSS